MRPRSWLTPLVLVLVTARCNTREVGADDHSAAGDTAPAATPAPSTTMPMAGRMPMRGTPMRGGMMQRGGGAAPQARAATAAATEECPAVTQALVDEGKTVFSSTGNCSTCHGANARGTALAPDLTDSTWLNIDGSYGSIANLVRTGVPQPKKYPAPMPPMGGANLSAKQLCAVAAYVYSLSHH